jgi:AcrR family transcriptional regulator
MVRWAGDARGRLERAAMELYDERGFDNTTVADIAERAGLTERTFFRYFADKREVLFGGANELQDLMVRAVTNAPYYEPPLVAAAAGLDAAAEFLEERRQFARRRQAIIAGNAELRERELIKLASLSAALADALRGRGVNDPAASLTGEIAVGVFKVAFERWVDQANQRPLTELMGESLGQVVILSTDAVGSSPSASRRSSSP